MQLRSLAGPVYLPTFLFALGISAVVPVIPLFARDLGAGDGLVGVIVAMRAIGTTTLDVPAGALASHFGNGSRLAWPPGNGAHQRAEEDS